MGAIWNDIGYAWRRLRRSPGFAVAAVVTLTLGIGASTAIFSLFQQVFLRVLPVDKPGELVQLRYTGVFKGHSHTFGGDEHQYFSYPMYRDLRARGTEFAGVIGDDMAGVGAMWHGQSQMERAELVAGD